jgi:hypothetical protein
MDFANLAFGFENPVRFSILSSVIESTDDPKVLRAIVTMTETNATDKAAHEMAKKREVGLKPLAD